MVCRRRRCQGSCRDRPAASGFRRCVGECTSVTEAVVWSGTNDGTSRPCHFATRKTNVVDCHQSTFWVKNCNRNRTAGLCVCEGEGFFVPKPAMAIIHSEGSQQMERHRLNACKKAAIWFGVLWALA